MRATNKRLTILSKFEQFALYSLPDFNEVQRAEYLTFTEAEQKLILNRSKLHSQIYCALQIGYFKAKQFFFRFTWQEIPEEDIKFILNNYFPNSSLITLPITDHEYYTERKVISTLFKYQLWSKSHLPSVVRQVANIIRRDTNFTFIITELLAFLKKQRIIRPDYSVLQDIISKTFKDEHERLIKIIQASISIENEKALQALLKEEDTISRLAALKQDAKDFKWTMLTGECDKLKILKPLYQLAKKILPTLEISQQNIYYYASLAHYYTIYELGDLNSGLTNLYLLCYVWQRYQQLTDNLVDAFSHKIRKFNDEAKVSAKEKLLKDYAEHQKNLPLVGNILHLFLKNFKKNTRFNSVQKIAFDILTREELKNTAKYLQNRPNEASLKWQFVDQNINRFKKNLRPLFVALDFTSVAPNSPWIAIIDSFKQAFDQQNKMETNKHMIEVVPSNLIQYLTKQDSSISLERYEFWLYLKVSYLLNGELYLNDSIKHKYLDHELVSLSEKEEELKKMDLPLLNQPIELHIKEKLATLNDLWVEFNEQLKQDKLSHLKFDKNAQELIWHKIKASDKKIQEKFYAQLPSSDIIDVLDFVDQKCNFLSAFRHLQPRYAKRAADKDVLLAVIIAQAMNYGNFKMAETSDIDYNSLDYTYKQYFRLATLKTANDMISNATASLKIFGHYCFDFNVIYGAVDGQKQELQHPTLSARHSQKHQGRGVVAYTLLANHIPIQTEIIGAHEHESYYVLDILQCNTSMIKPVAISGDMHSINKANFAILPWFGHEFTPRFTNLHTQLSHLYCGKKLSEYQDYLIKPVGQIKEQIIIEEWPNLKQIMATLALKETTQSTIIKKLCTYNHKNKLRKALFEYDKLQRSIYTLKYLLDLKLQQTVHHSQNRIESYHYLRAAIAQVNGKKELTGKTDIAIAISNETGRLSANAIIFFNSALLSIFAELIETKQLNEKALKKLRKISPVAWQHIHLLGHYNFKKDKKPLDLNALVKDLKLN